MLGKRARATASVQDSYSTPSRTKRLRVDQVNDENLEPTPPSSKADDSPYNGCNDDDPFISSVGRPKRITAYPVKATLPQRQNRVLSRNSNLIAHTIHDCQARGQQIGVTSDKAKHARDLQDTIQSLTPQTPRHRDALSKKIPITPRCLTTLAGKPSTPHTLRTPVTPASLLTVYHTARQSFVRSAVTGRLVGRDAERRELKAFIQDGSTNFSGRCLYISGPPGTGKSALVGEVYQDFENGLELRKAYVNCMSVKASGDVYDILSNDLFDESGETMFQQNDNLLSRLAPSKKSTGPVYLIVLDEIDHLLNLDLEIMYTLFELALQRTSRLILIGIANALDLTDRFLPRLKARNLKPQLLPFLPYTVAQVASVITTKLQALLPDVEGQPDYVPFVHPTAIQFCSKKVASQTGDLRKAFDIIHRSLTLVENETKQMHQTNWAAPMSPSKSPLSENPNLSSPSKPRKLATSLATLTPLTAPRATMSHVARVSASALGNCTSQRLQTLNLQQKAALGALMFLEKKKLSSQRRLTPSTPSKSSWTTYPTVRQVYETYCLLCKRDNALHPLTAVEFYDVFGGLETLGLAGESSARGFGKTTPSKKPAKREDRRLSSWVSEKDYECCLDGVGGSILQGLLESEE
ncbi:MAG: hypothetical protein Q9213_006137 [Squamulea squamosa]